MHRLAAVALLVPSAAFATDADPGLVFPGASTMAAGSGEFGLSAGLGQPGWSPNWGLGYHAQGGYAPTDSLAVTAQGVLGENGGGMVALGARYRFAVGEGFAVAPFVLGTSTGPAEMPVLLPGLALEGGWQHVRLDLAVPVAMVGIEGPQLQALLLHEAGVTFVSGQHRLRLGTTTIASPTVSYRWTGDAFYVEAAVADLAWVGGAPRFAMLGGGWRF